MGYSLFFYPEYLVFVFPVVKGDGTNDVPIGIRDRHDPFMDCNHVGISTYYGVAGADFGGRQFQVTVLGMCPVKIFRTRPAYRHVTVVIVRHARIVVAAAPCGRNGEAVVASSRRVSPAICACRRLNRGCQHRNRPWWGMALLIGVSRFGYVPIYVVLS